MMKSLIPLISQRLYKNNLIAGTDGNVSEKKFEKIYITAKGVNKSQLTEKEICIMNLQAQNLKGEASSEKYMHLAVYKSQPLAQAVIHAHPPSAIALSLARPKWKKLPPAFPEILISLGEVPFLPYLLPGSKKLAESLKPFVKTHKALILSQHGALTWGENLEDAFNIMEQLEHSCKILCLSESMGKSQKLSTAHRKELIKNHIRSV